MTVRHDEEPGRRLRWALIPWYPIVLAATYVINLWVESGVSMLAASRPLAMAVVGAGLLLAVLTLVSRRPHLAGVATLVVILILLSRGPLYIGALVVLALAATFAVVIVGRIRRRPISLPDVTRTLNIVSVLLLVVVLAGGVTRGTYGAVLTDLDQGSGTLEDPPGAGQQTDRPNVYLLMLDGYPRADSLERLFGVDNDEFLDALRDRGFAVAEGSQSNYMFTQLTLTSMLHMQPLMEIDALDPVIDGSADSNVLMRTALNDNPVFDIFRDRGYRIVTSSPGYEHVGLRQADVYLDEGQLNEFEYQLLRFTTAQRIVNLFAPDFFADQQRDRIRSGFEHFTDLVESRDRPTFGFIHVPSPHLPVVFTEDGSDAYLPPSEDIFDWAEIDPATREAYGRQIHFLNDRVIELIDEAMGAQPDGVEPVIIIMSDHGAAPRPAIFIGEGTDEHYANFFAARTPDVDDPFADDISPVNVFPTLFNTYFGTDIAAWPNDRYPWVDSP